MVNGNVFHTTLVILVMLKGCISSEEFSMQGNMSVEPIAAGEVLFIALDEFIPGNLLLIDTHALITWNGSSSTATNVAGLTNQADYIEGIGEDAKFDKPSSFVQLTPTSVIIADRNSHCNRHLDRESRQTTPFAGLCVSRGHVDGLFIDARFSSPFELVQCTRDLLYLSDRDNSAVKMLNLQDSTVLTLIQDTNILDQVKGIIQPDSARLYLLSKLHISLYDLKQKTLTVIAGGSPAGFYDGELLSARFHFLHLGFMVNTHQILATDSVNRRLRLVDLETGQVSSICTGGNNDTIGTESTCETHQPRSLFLYGGKKIYMGALNNIRSFNACGITRPTKSQNKLIWKKDQSCQPTLSKPADALLHCASICLKRMSCLRWTFAFDSKTCYLEDNLEDELLERRTECYVPG